MPVALPIGEALLAGGEAIAGGTAAAEGGAAVAGGAAAAEGGAAAAEGGTAATEGGGLASKIGGGASSALKMVGQHEAFKMAGDAFNALEPKSTPEGRIAQMSSMLSPHQFGG